MAKTPVCEECGRSAEVQLQGPVALCRRCAGLVGPGLIERRPAHQAWPCVVCGQEAVADMESDEGLERPVCYEHMLPGAYIDVMLLRQELMAALTDIPAVRRIRAALLRLAEWLNGRFGDE
jgi:hypothetical protein